MKSIRPVIPNRAQLCIFQELLTALLLALSLAPSVTAGDDGLGPDSLRKSSASAGDPARLEWFRNAKFGMFIHWGPYAVAAGEWGDRDDFGEWLQLEAGLLNPEYEMLAARFNPVNFNAKQWASIAKAAGMKYIVITAKHHDGFCMYDSKFTDYDIIDATPFKRDPMKELSDAARADGLRFGFYYSLTDWHHPEMPREFMQESHGSRSIKKFPGGFHGAPNPAADMKTYNQYMRDQVGELLTGYGPVCNFWFDAGGAFNKVNRAEVVEADKLAALIHEKQPACLINNRLGAGADYGTPEQKIPGTAISEPFEVCMTLNKHWGYNKADQNWKPSGEVVEKLADIASKGGNFLLNVGPMANGEFPPESVRILGEVGKWMDVNSESIYDTTASPLDKTPPWGRVTAKPGRLYLHVLKWPSKKTLNLDFPGIPAKAWLLADKTPCAVVRNKGVITISVPDKAPDPVDSVIVLELAGSAP